MCDVLLCRPSLFELDLGRFNEFEGGLNVVVEVVEICATLRPVGCEQVPIFIQDCVYGRFYFGPDVAPEG